MSVDVEEALASAKRALKEARETISLMVERGDYGAAIEALATTVDKAFSRLGEALVKSVKDLHESVSRLAESVMEQRENVDRLTKNVDKLTVDVRELRRSLELEAHIRRSEVGGLRGEVVELRVIRGLADWFRKHAPEYEVYDWPMRRGPDLIVEGKGILAAVEATVRPKAEDVEQLIAGAGVVKLEWGRKPDLLVIYSYSGEVPEDVAEYATGKDVKIVRGPRELKKLLDEAVSSR